MQILIIILNYNITYKENKQKIIYRKKTFCWENFQTSIFKIQIAHMNDLYIIFNKLFSFNNNDF